MCKALGLIPNTTKNKEIKRGDLGLCPHEWISPAMGAMNQQVNGLP
jgi:hypothetical protein